MKLATLPAADGVTVAAVWVERLCAPLPFPDLNDLLTHTGAAIDAVAHLAEEAARRLASRLLRCRGRRRSSAAASTTPTTSRRWAASCRPTRPSSPSTPTRLLGPEDDIVLPAGVDVDWEAELAVVVGADLARRRPSTRPGGRSRLHGRQRHLRARLAEPHAPVVPGQGLGRHHPARPGAGHPRRDRPVARGVEVICRVNGVERQRGNTKTLVFDCGRPAGLRLHLHRAAPRRRRPDRHPRRRRHGHEPADSTSPTATSSRPRSPASAPCNTVRLTA